MTGRALNYLCSARCDVRTVSVTERFNTDSTFPDDDEEPDVFLGQPRIWHWDWFRKAAVGVAVFAVGVALGLLF